MNFSLSLTHDCNLACIYCYAGHKHPTAMSAETADRAIDFGLELSTKSVQLGFFGGEPLLQWDLLTRATLRAEERCRERGLSLQLTVTTNGTLVTEERARWLREHDFYPGLSIDGNRAMHEISRPLRGGASSWDATIAGLRILRSHYPDLEVIVVPDPRNIEHLAASVRYLHDEEGVVDISINPNFYIEWDDEALHKWEQAYEEIGDYYIESLRRGDFFQVNFIDGKIITHLKNGFEACDKCGFAEHEFAVAPSGNLYGCERLIGDDDNEEMLLGNVFDGFDTQKRMDIIAQRGSNVNLDCLECSYRNRCMNWCHCINYATTGAINVTDGVVCFHERIAIRVADRVGEILYAEKNPLFLHHFYDLQSE